MHALTELTRIDSSLSLPGEYTYSMNGFTIVVNPKSQTGRVYDGEYRHLAVAEHYCAVCANRDRIGSNDGEADCVHKQALDAALGDIYSDGLDAMIQDCADDADTVLAAMRGVL